MTSRSLAARLFLRVFQVVPLPLGLSLFLASALGISCTLSGERPTASSATASKVSEARIFAESGEYQHAIESYQQHINDRLEEKNRPKWENPYFYELLIGDLQLLDNNPKEARTSYEKAESQQVERELVADRYRKLARWLFQNGNTSEALSLIEEKKHLDPLLFDSLGDRISRESLREFH